MGREVVDVVGLGRAALVHLELRDQFDHHEFDHHERIYLLQDQRDHIRRPPAGVVVLLGSRFLSHTTRS